MPVNPALNFREEEWIDRDPAFESKFIPGLEKQGIAKNLYFDKRKDDVLRAPKGRQKFLPMPSAEGKFELVREQSALDAVAKKRRQFEEKRKRDNSAKAAKASKASKAPKASKAKK